MYTDVCPTRQRACSVGKERREREREKRQQTALPDLEIVREKLRTHFSEGWGGVDPTSNGSTQKWEAQSGQVHVAHTGLFFATFWTPTCVLSRRFSNKNFWRRSSGGSLLRVRVAVGWVGRSKKINFFFLTQFFSLSSENDTSLLKRLHLHPGL